MAQRTQKVTVELGFKSNTAEIKRNINELAANLKQLSNMEIGLKGGDLDRARSAARELALELQKAVNVDTGKLDLTKLTRSLQISNKSIKDLSAELLRGGQVGQQSFLQLARAISSAEVPAVKLNKTVKDFIDNLGKTAKYQIAQTAIQGIQSSLQNSVREAEQLNKALNDIRIVTGLDQNAMAKFAKEANKAAKELKTTTKEYAEASLIFYQQGLSGSEAAKRAETVIKLSQVTGDTAKVVSDQMTAIWNNFADGTKTLEYYADAMAKLGADTAASTSEIANGLEKFAAIAETVGLSYETAMASVTTVIDKTRQSADVVGTAFKTIFARVQGLSLDGVTDDGVSLNKYSKALEKVGVDVLTASGELRDMDDILNDLGSKWEGLGKETQVAVAQVVGGARQYNQILALMDNWADVQNNINKATSATGELDKQADIWADSYEAAAKRVEEAKARASENFLNSDDVVALTNFFADLIEGVDKFIDSMGGIVPLGITILGLFSKKLIPIMKTGFTSLKENLFTLFGGSERLLNKTQTEMAKYLSKLETSGIEKSLIKQYEWSRKLILAKQEMANAVKYMSEQEKASALAVLDIYEETVNTAIKANQAVSKSEKRVQETDKKFSVKDLREKAKEKQAQREEEFFTQQGIDSKEEREKIRKLSSEKFSQQDIDNNRTILKNLEDAKQEEQNIRARLTINSALYKLNEEENIQAKKNLEINKKGPKQQYRKIIKRTKETMDDIQESNKTDSIALRETEKKIKDYSDLGVTEEKVQTYETALKFRDIRQETDIPQSTKDLKKYSFGQQDIDSYFSFGEILDENVLKEFKKVQDQLFDTSVVGDYVVAFEKHNDQLDISLGNYESLIRQSIKYEAQLVKLGNITSELDKIDLSTQAQYEEERDQAKAEIEKTETKIKTGGETPENIEALRKAKDNYAKTEMVLAKVQKQNSAVIERATKLIKGNKKQLLETAKQAGYSEDALEELNKEIDNLNLQDAQNIEKIKSQMNGLNTVTQRTKEAFDNMGKDMAGALGDEIGAENIKEKTEAMEELRESILEQTEAEDQAILTEEEFTKSTKDISTTFEDIVGTVGQTTAAIAGLQGGINQLFEAFNSGNTPMETFMGILGALISMAPAVGMAIDLISKAKSKATKKEIADNTAEMASDTAEATGEVIGEAAKATATMNPVHIAAAAAGLALLGAVAVGSIAGNVSKNKKEQQRESNTANIEAAEKSNELATATKTESQAIDELVSQYNKLSATGEDTVAIKEDIINQTDKVIAKYKEYADTINMTIDAEEALKAAIEELETAQTLNDVEGIKKAQEKADLAIAENAKKLNDAGIAGTLGNARLNEEARDVKVVKDGIQRRVGGTGAEEEEANKILQDKMGDSATEAGKKGSRIKLRTGKPEDFIEDYNNLQEAVDEMLSSDNEAISDPSINDTLRECQELLADYKDTYDSLKSQMATGAIYNTQIAMGSTGKSVSDISSYNDYNAYKTAVEEKIDKNENLTEEEKTQAKESLETQLSTNSELENFVKIDKKLDILAEKTGKTKEELSELITEANQEAFLEVNLNVYSNEEDIKAEIDRIQNEIDRKENQVKINSILSIEEILKPEGMTAEDWAKIEEEEIFKDNLALNFTDFLNMSYSEQLIKLSSQKADLEKQNIQKLQEDIESYKNTLATTKDASAWDAAKAGLAEAEKQLAITLKVQEANRKYLADLRASDVGDIYHTINQELSELERHYSKIQELQNDIYGENSIALYDELLDNLKGQNAALQKKIELSKKEASAEKTDLVQDYQDTFKGLDSDFKGFEFDTEGNLTNYDQIINMLSNKKKAGINVDELIKSFEEDYGTYTSAVEEVLSNEDALENNKRLEKELNFKKITAKLDLQVEINDLYLKQYEHEIQKATKSISTSSNALEIYGKQITAISNLTNTYEEQYNKLQAAYAAGEITEADYVTRLKEIQDESYANIETLEQLKESLINFYSEDLQRAQEEISKYIDRMESATSVLEHYKTILELTGDSSSESMRTVLKGVADTAKSNLEASRSIYEFYNEKAKEPEKELNDYIKSQGASLDKENDENYKRLEKNFLEAESLANESRDKMLSDTAEWGTAMKEQVEFDMNQIAKEIEQAFTGGKSFDEITVSMTRRSTLQEDFLTTTNKIYETTKLMRTAQQAIDSATNTQSKRKLKAFMDETKQLQNQEKLSTFELDVQQKKYDLLLAEIALRDAENAKSTVRLTRTADGGFGYVYTADENKVAETQQAYADAENALYNTRLEAANSYTEKTIQAQQEFHQAMQDLTQQYFNGEIESEDEYQRKKEELVAYYSELLGNYSDIYKLSIEEDTAIVTDAWSTVFSEMVTNTEGWSINVNDYFAKTEEKMSGWKTFVAELKETVGLDFDSIGSSVGGVTTKVDLLADALTDPDNGVVKAMDDFIEKGKDWINNHAQSLLDYISSAALYFDALATNVLSAVDAMSKLDTTKIPEGEQKFNGEGVEEDLTSGYKAAGLENKETGGLWQEVYTRALNGEDVGEFKDSKYIDYNQTEKYNQGMQNAFEDAKALGQSHREQGLTSSEYTAGNIVKGNDDIISDDAISQVNTDYAENLAKAKEGIRTDTSFRYIANSTVPGERPEEEVKYTGLTEEEIEVVKRLRSGSGEAKAMLDNNPKEAAIYNSMKENQKKLGVDDATIEKVVWIANSDYFSQEGREAFYDKVISDKGFTKEAIDKLKDYVTPQALQYTPNAIDETKVMTAYPTAIKANKYKDKIEISGKTFLSKTKDACIKRNGDGTETSRIFSIGTYRMWPGNSEEIWVRQQDIKALLNFDTGGYTGSWGPEGKMAMLHQKEIVLNETDTTNFLESIKLLRSILSFIDLQATNAQFSSLLSNSHFTPSTSEVLEQNVHIDAHFDSVTDRNEIVEAFNTLVNRASQYANRKK